MVIKIKKGRALNKPRPAAVTPDALPAKVSNSANDKMRAALKEYAETDPRHIEAMKRPIGERGTKCEYCKAVYHLTCDAEEKEFCLNHLSLTGKVKNMTEWSPYADQLNALKLERLAERKKEQK